ncbi:hypothetical protein Tco_1110936 [Tanacetum coccineum]|uniref:Uncharacterized protein n=1 Tax=Tanacetum coccineum TaxID=301880 RepID=A0ABQ5IMN7_9ASTR
MMAETRQGCRGTVSIGRGKRHVQLEVMMQASASRGCGVMVTAAAAAMTPERGWRHVDAPWVLESEDIDEGSIFYIGQKSHRKSFLVADNDGGGGGQRRGSGGGWLDLGRGEGVRSSKGRRNKDMELKVG